MANETNISEVLRRNKLTNAHLSTTRKELRHEPLVSDVFAVLERLLDKASALGGPVEVFDEIDDARAILREVLR